MRSTRTGYPSPTTAAPAAAEHEEDTVDGKVVVPALVGLTMDDAVHLATTAGVAVEQVTMTGVVPPDAVVDAQQPLAGLQVDPGSAVQVTLDDTGGGGGGSALDPPPPVLDGPSGAGTAVV